MKKNDMLTTVLTVACETQDRSRGEQTAMLALALDLDLHRGRFVTGASPMPPTLVAHVEATYEPSAGKPVTLDAKQRASYDALVDRWTQCSECGYPTGMHYVGGRCPSRIEKQGLMDALAAWRRAGAFA